MCLDKNHIIKVAASRILLNFVTWTSVKVDVICSVLIQEAVGDDLNDLAVFILCFQFRFLQSGCQFATL